MMYKFGVGQNVIFRDCIEPKYKYGMITGGITTFENYNLKVTYTILSGEHYYANVKEEDIQEYTETLESQKVSNCDFSTDIWKWAKDQKPIDTRNYDFNKTHQNHLLDAQRYTLSSIFLDEKKLGLPHEVHFKEKRNRTTLVWKVKSIFGKETYSTTIAEAHNEKFDRLYGFLMAYFKKVHEYQSKTWRKKYLEKNVYALKHKEQINYLTTIFAQNCGLETEKVYEYLKEIVKDKE